MEEMKEAMEAGLNTLLSTLFHQDYQAAAVTDDESSDPDIYHSFTPEKRELARANVAKYELMGKKFVELYLERQKQADESFKLKKEKVETLKLIANTLCYRPDGSNYKEVKEHFSSLGKRS